MNPGLSDPCRCCEGVQPETPVQITNRPGLSAIAYRSGTWAQFKASMLAALSAQPALAGLQSRSDDDFTVALVDAWAVACDILTFYQERIANESYLRCATERVSVGELAKLIGYKLRPGLAASAAVVFTLDTPPPLPPASAALTFALNSPAATQAGPPSPPSGLPPSVPVAVGSRAQTVPDPGAQPATFETIGPITARAEWNAIGVRMMAPAERGATTNLRLTGVSGLVASIKVGDTILVHSGNDDVVQSVASVQPDPATRTTVVTFAHAGDPVAAPPPVKLAVASSGSVLDDGFVWSSVRDVVWQDQQELVAIATARGWSTDDLEAAINALAGTFRPGAEAPVAAYSMGIDASLFGHNAPTWSALPPTTRPADWTNYTLATIPDWAAPPAATGYLMASPSFVRVVGTSASPPVSQVDLDNTYPVVAGDRVVLSDPVRGGRAVTTAKGVQVLTLNGYLMSSKVTRISLTTPLADSANYGLRTTRILVQTAELPVAGVLVTETVTGATATLDGAYLSLRVGQLVAVTGARADQQGGVATEITAIAGLSLVDGYTTVTFQPVLTGTYVRSTVRINANVAPATHGETASETLGSGDASKAFQRFPLKQPPLTYVTASTSSGTASTLAVRVDGVLWSEVAWLSGSRRTDKVYMVILGSDGKTYVQFGDGVTGARPGSGTNNIVATYRHGIGLAGIARAGQISTLLSRPLGLKAVVNPLPSSGAADPETVDQARTNAPVTVKSLERIVSLEDVGDFAAASAGIAKASVHWIWDGTRYVACVTVAGAGGAPVTPGTPQYTSLLQAMQNATDGTLPITLCNYVPVAFRVKATITPDPLLVATDVLASVKSALTAAFSFPARSFAQPVYRSEVIERVQSVPGVVAMTLDDLDYVTPHPVPFFIIWGDPRTFFAPDPLVAQPPTVGAGGLIGAQLLSLQPGTLPGVVLAS